MSNPLEIIQPSLRYQREQRELEKVFVVDTPEGADGLGRVDLKSGHIKIPVRTPAKQPEAPEEWLARARERARLPTALQCQRRWPCATGASARPGRRHGHRGRRAARAECP